MKRVNARVNKLKKAIKSNSVVSFNYRFDDGVRFDEKRVIQPTEIVTTKAGDKVVVGLHGNNFRKFRVDRMTAIAQL